MFHSKLKNKSQPGFTLLELLIAMVIFAIMSVMAYGGLSSVIDNSHVSQGALDRLQQLQHTVSMLNRDFTQIRQRSIRDSFGQEQAFISTHSNEDNLIEFTRGGRLNPANLRRSSLLRVAYRLQENELLRFQWPDLDRAPGSEPRENMLIDNVDDIRIRYLDNNAQWQEQWPPVNFANVDNDGNAVATPSPTAIEVILTLSDWGDIRRLYALK